MNKIKNTPCLAAVLLLLAALHPARAQVINNNGGGAVATSVTVSTLSTGNNLDITPVVSPDGRYVSMRMNLSFSTLDGIDLFVFPAPVNTTNLQLVPGGGLAPVRPGGPGLVGINGLTGQGLMRSGIPVALPMSFSTGVSTMGLTAPAAAGGFFAAPAPAQVVLPAGNPPAWNLNPTSPYLSVAPAAPPALAAPQPGILFIDEDKKLLATPVPALTSDSLSLANALKQLALLSKNNIVLGRAWFKAAGIDVTAPLKLDLPAGTLQASLDALLKTAAPDQALVVTAEDNVIDIATQAQADRHIISKTYYEEDLVANAPLWMKRAAGDHDGDGIQKIGQKHGTGTIMDLIVATVRPEIWKANGGKIGEIYEVKNRVTIKAPESVHALLEGPAHFNPNAAPIYVNYQQ